MNGDKWYDLYITIKQRLWQAFVLFSAIVTIGLTVLGILNFMGYI